MEAYGNEGAAGDDGAGAGEGVEVAEAAGGPVGQRDANQGDASEHGGESSEEAFFQSEKSEGVREEVVWRQEAARVGEDSDETREQDHLVAEKHDKA